MYLPEKSERDFQIKKEEELEQKERARATGCITKRKPTNTRADDVTAYKSNERTTK